MSNVQESFLRLFHIDETLANSLRGEALPVQALLVAIFPGIFLAWFSIVGWLPASLI